MTVTELRKHLKACLALVDSLEADKPIPLEEMDTAIRLYKLIDTDLNAGRSLTCMAWCSIGTYYKNGKPDSELSYASGIWPMTGCRTKREADIETKRLNDHEKEKHRTHPWWGSYEDNGQHYKTKLVECRISMLKALKKDN